MKRSALLAVIFLSGLGLSQFAASGPRSFCERKPSHPRCRTTTVTTTAPPPTTTAPPPTTTHDTTTAPPPPTTTGELKANVWLAP